MPTFESLRDTYSKLLKTMVVKASWQSTIDRTAKRLLDNRAQYEKVEGRLGIPWMFIAVLHWRESGANFHTHLHNGDPLSARTTHVPKGRPVEPDPPYTWDESAEDALMMMDMHLIKDWSLERICYEAERYNGWGYRNYNRNLSPYLWSGTEHYKRGKYSSDGKFDPYFIDQQLGVMPLYMAMVAREPAVAVEHYSRKITILQRVRLAIQAMIAGVGSLFTLDTLGIFQDWITAVKDLIPIQTVVVIVALGIAGFLVAKVLEDYIQQDAAEGRYTPSGAVNEDGSLKDGSVK